VKRKRDEREHEQRLVAWTNQNEQRHAGAEESEAPR
jgi:hypothetical protein